MQGGMLASMFAQGCDRVHVLCTRQTKLQQLDLPLVMAMLLCFVPLAHACHHATSAYSQLI
jgi:hypothetical protein